MNFLDKVCVVTGGAGGIGRCIAEAFLRAGALVCVIDTDAASGQRLTEAAPQGRLAFFEGDVSNPQTLEAFCAAVLEAHGGVDVLVNNACITRRGLLSGCSYDDFMHVLKVGVAAPYYLTSLLKDGFNARASIVNISSTRERMSQPDTESYTAAKGGISALMHALSISLSGKVRVNAVCPGWIDTGAYHGEVEYISQHSDADKRQHPSGRVGVPEDIASMVLYLCSDAAAFINGESITIDGGMSRQMIYHGDGGWAFEPQDNRIE